MKLSLQPHCCLNYDLFKFISVALSLRWKIEKLTLNNLSFRSISVRSLFSALAKQKLILDSPGYLRSPCSLGKLKNN